jgi:hypothetical protein
MYKSVICYSTNEQHICEYVLYDDFKEWDKACTDVSSLAMFQVVLQEIQMISSQQDGTNILSLENI